MDPLTWRTMSELTAENMFSAKSYEASMVVSLVGLSSLDKKRMIVHAIAALTQQLISQPNASPTGVTVTTMLRPAKPGEAPELVITATCPQYEFSESSFSI